jgi:phenylalanine-4-hydroxylase
MGNYVAKTPDANGLLEFTNEENETWEILSRRQVKVIEGRACDEFIAGIERLGMPMDRIPQIAEVSEAMRPHTGWSVKAVPAIIPINDFFQLLVNRQFPAATFIRTREELDYLQEPDLFHEYFGHCPLLTYQPYADFVQAYGEVALRADKKVRKLIARLFWYTIEFGLLNTPKGTRIYGGGILSSKAETIFATDSDKPKRLPLDIMTALRTPYDIDVIQPIYFCLEKLSDLYQILEHDLIAMAKEAIALGEIIPSNEIAAC